MTSKSLEKSDQDKRGIHSFAVGDSANAIAKPTCSTELYEAQPFGISPGREADIGRKDGDKPRSMSDRSPLNTHFRFLFHTLLAIAISTLAAAIVLATVWRIMTPDQQTVFDLVVEICKIDIVMMFLLLLTTAFGEGTGRKVAKLIGKALL